MGCVVVGIAVATMAHARDGDLVTTFGDDGIARLGVTNVYGSTTMSKPVVGPGGTITYCGTRNVVGAGRDFHVARVKANGVLDTSFSFDGRAGVDFDGNDDECNAIAIQADGRIIAVGSTQSATSRNFALARFTSTGALDSTFGVNGRLQVQFDVFGSDDSSAYAIALQTDGRIVVAGDLHITPGIYDFAIARLLADGSYDTAFNGNGRQRVRIITPDGTERASGLALAIDTIGRMVVGGYARKHAAQASDYDFAAARLLGDGTLDATFGNGGSTTVALDLGGTTGTNDDVSTAMALQADGKILLAGKTDVSATVTPNTDMAVIRLLPSGVPDAAFGMDGHVIVPFDRHPSGGDEALAMTIDGGNITLGGYAFTSAQSADIALVRLLSNGSRDASFGNLGRRTFDLHLTNPPIQYIAGLSTESDHLIFSGIVKVGDNDAADAFVGQLENDTILAYGME